MKPFSRCFTLFWIGVAWLTASSIPAMAQVVLTPTATLSCGPPASYTATAIVSESRTADNNNVTFQIAATPSTGTPILINASVGIPPLVTGNFSVSGNWSPASEVTYTLSGTAVVGSGVIFSGPVQFTNANNQITCLQQPFPLSAKLEIERNSFELNASFTLSSTAPAIDPVNQLVTLQVGPFTTMIQPGSFKKNTNGSFSFEGKINGVRLEVRIKPTVTLSYSFHAEANGANMTGTTNPVLVMLTIGNNIGTASAKTKIEHGGD